MSTISKINIENNVFEIKDEQARNDIEIINDTKATNEDLNREIDERTNSYESLDNSLKSLDNKVKSLASGSPLTATSISGMTDTSKVYVNTSDGKWYYHNGASWVAGGTYQSTGIGIGEVKAENLESSLQESLKTRVPEIIWISGGYRNTYGERIEHANYSYSEPIPLKQNETIYVYSNGGNPTIVSIITGVNNENNEICKSSTLLKVQNVGDRENLYSFKAPFDMYACITKINPNDIIFCYISSGDKDLDLIKNSIGVRVPEYEINTHKYNNNGEYIDHVNYGYTSPIKLNAGETIKAHTRGEGTVITLLSKVDSAGTYQEPLIQTNGTKEYDIEYTTSEEIYVSICSDMRYLANIFIIKKEEQKELNSYYKNLFSSFIKFGVVGDSLASGEAVAKNNGSLQYIDNYDYSWGQFIARNHGMECVNFSLGGATTRTWLDESNNWGLAKAKLPENKCNAYIIGLGVNDPNRVELGSINDVNVNDYTQNPDTFYGNYGRIIGNLKTIQPKAKIFILTMVNDWGAYLTAIREIANLYEHDVYLIDLNADHYQEINTGYVMDNKREGHYNAVAYNCLGEILYSAMSDYMYKNVDEFKQIEFIGTNYQY